MQRRQKNQNRARIAFKWRTVSDSDEYEELLKSPESQARRLEILNDREWNCEECGSCLGLEVHHKDGYICDRYGDFIHPAEYPDHRLEVPVPLLPYRTA